MKSDSPEDADIISSAERWLDEHTGYKRPYDRRYGPLDFQVRRFFEAAAHQLGDPHLRYPVIHIAGSKGKGSVAHLISYALQKRGFRVGLSISPHLVSKCERALVDFEPCTETELARSILDIAAVADGISGRATFSGAISLAAMLHFAHREVDVAVIECGLGGERDATGFLNAPICVLTFVELEHTAQLGDNLADIAREKAGIVSEGETLICGVTDNGALNAVRSLVKDKGARLVSVDTSGRSARASCEAVANAALRSFETLHGLVRGDISFEGFTIPGRDDIRTIGDSKVLFDGAHTPASLADLALRLPLRFEGKPVLVFYCTPPRDPLTLAGVLEHACSKRFYLVRHEGQGVPKGFEPLPICSLPDFVRLEKACVITGSFHAVGDSMKILRVEPYPHSPCA